MPKNRLYTDNVTITDVAKRAGVAISTVSHVINGTAPISEKTTKKVLASIEELNYSPNALARAMRQKNTKLIGIILQDISSEFYARCISSMLKEARKDRYVLLVCDAAYDKEGMADEVKALLERQVDGLIFIGGTNDDSIISDIKSKGLPLILGDRTYDNVHSIEFNNRDTMYNLTCSLHKNGYNNFIYIGENIDIQTNLKDRLHGFQDGISQCGIESKNATVLLRKELREAKYEGGYNLFLNNKELFSTSSDKKTVVLTSNDMISQGILSGASKLGFDIPNDFSIIGFDNMLNAKYSHPPLTTVEQDVEQLGIKCYQTMISLILGKQQPIQKIIQQKIIVRDSALLKQNK
ncbi:MAG: LacI family DNA-binding transcriptional regulator [Suipraeoptans sp.]